MVTNDERVQRYAEAMHPGAAKADWWGDDVQAVMAVADAELAELRAEVEQVRLGARTLGEIIHRQCRDALDATGLHNLIDEDGDGDWGLVWEHLAELRPRVEAAEARVVELLAEIADRESERADLRDRVEKAESE